MARPKGSKQTRPTNKAIAGYYEQLKSAAENGDTLAAAELIKINILGKTRGATHAQ